MIPENVKSLFAGGRVFWMGTALYETAGANYDFAQAELEKKKPGKKFKGVVVFTVKAAYDQTRGPNAGALIWSDAS